MLVVYSCNVKLSLNWGFEALSMHDMKDQDVHFFGFLFQSSSLNVLVLIQGVSRILTSALYRIYVVGGSYYLSHSV